MIKIKPYINNKHCEIISKRLSIWSGLESRSSWIRWKLPLPLRKSIWRSQSESVKLLSHVRIFVTPWTVACQAPPSMRFCRQENWSMFLFYSPGYLPDPRTEPRSLTFQAYSLQSEPPGNPMKRWGSNKKSSLGEKSASNFIAWLFWISPCF